MISSGWDLKEIYLAFSILWNEFEEYNSLPGDIGVRKRYNEGETAGRSSANAATSVSVDRDG